MCDYVCVCMYILSAVQEERQRAKERSEAELELAGCSSEDMPVEKILEAELAVEPKTETYVEGSLGAPASSVSLYLCVSPCLSFSPTHTHTHTHTDTHTHTHTHTLQRNFVLLHNLHLKNQKVNNTGKAQYMQVAS